MRQKSDTGTGPTSLLERIQAGMSAVASIPPVVEGGEPVGRRDKVVGHCDDFLKRLKVYHSSLIEEVEPLRSEGARLEGSLIEAVEGISKVSDAAKLFKQLAGLATPELVAKADRMAVLKVELDPKVRYVNFVGDYFWAEVRSRIPAAADEESIGVRDDWSIVVTDSKQSAIEELLGGLMRGSRRRPERVDA